VAPFLSNGNSKQSKGPNMKLRNCIPVLAAAMGLAASPAFSQATRARTLSVQNAGSSYLGIGVLDITPERARMLNLKEARGAEVARVDENGPAAKAGIKQGDVILDYNGTPLEGMAQLIRMVRETPPGHTIKVVIWRNGATQDIAVTVGERPGNAIEPPTVPIPEFGNMPPIEIPRFQWAWQSSMLGIEGESLGQERQFAEYFGVRDGVLVKEVMRSSPAEKAGLKAGDVITKVNGADVTSTRDITAQLRSSRDNRTVTLTIFRDKHEMPLKVTLDQAGANPNPNPPEPPAQRF
jgi:serine protease Do